MFAKNRMGSRVIVESLPAKPPLRDKWKTRGLQAFSDQPEKLSRRASSEHFYDENDRRYIRFESPCIACVCVCIYV